MLIVVIDLRFDVFGFGEPLFGCFGLWWFACGLRVVMVVGWIVVMFDCLLRLC